MASPTLEPLPPHIETAVREAIARDSPARRIGTIRICCSTPSAFVLRVFLPLPGLKPSPYCIYQIELLDLAAKRLEGCDAAPYQITNYK